MKTCDKKILIVEDEPAIAELVEFNLRKNGFDCKRAESAESARKLIESADKFDLILLDLMLPGMDGADFCRELKADARFASIPVVMVTARGEESDIVSGLDYGASDYITKPFSPRVLIARIRAQLRDGALANNASTTKLKVHGIELDLEFHEARASGRTLELTANEFEILHLFMGSAGKVFSRDAIIKGLHGEGYPVTDRAVDVSIVNLRRKLGSKADIIETVRGVGYRMPRP